MRYRALLFTLAALALVGSLSSAQTSTCVGINVPLQPMGFEQITVSNTAIGFTAASITVAETSTGLLRSEAIVAVVTIESQAVRYRDDGTSPTSTVGQPVSAGSTLIVCGRTAVRAVKFIRSGGSDATASVTYYKRAQ